MIPSYFELPEEKKKEIKEYFLKFLFTRKPFTIVTSTLIGGGYDPIEKRINGAEFLVVAKITSHFRTDFAAVINKARKHFFKLAKSENRCWTLTYPTIFLTDYGQMNGRLVTDVSGDVLKGFSFKDGTMYIKVLCYGLF